MNEDKIRKIICKLSEEIVDCIFNSKTKFEANKKAFNKMAETVKQLSPFSTGEVIAEGKAENILNDAGSEFFYIGDYELDTIYETLELAIRKNEGKKVKLILQIDE